MNIDLRDEVRNGFYVPTAIKQAWNAQIKVLSEIDRICNKYNIEYFADWGTLLSAVRHGGYIPWDDDLDICMKREDYIKFREVADRELPSSFAIHDYERQKDHWLFIAKVVNCNHISFEEEHLKEYNNFPYIACVDIFLLDYLYKDSEKEDERREEIKRLLAYADGIVEGRISGNTKEAFLKEIDEKYNFHIDRSISNNDCGIKLYGLIEKQMARVEEKEADRIGQIFPFVLKGFNGYPKEYYKKSISIPYENGTIRVPCAYDEVLSKKYGNYLKIIKGIAAHGYPFFEGQKLALSEVGNVELPEFKFDKGRIKQDIPVSEDTLKNIACECIVQIENLLNYVFELFAFNSVDEMIRVLPDIQQLAIDLGTLTDSIKGEGNLAVDCLSDLCEKLYFLYENPENVQCRNDLEESFSKVKVSVNENIINKETAVFLSVGAKNWESFSKLYEEEKRNNADVYIINIPLYYKDIFGNLTLADNLDMGEFPDELKVCEMGDINLPLLHPDRIYIQDSYESYNPALSIHPNYYGSVVKEYSNELIFVQPMDFFDFSKDDTCEMYNIHHYALKPGVMYASKIYLSSPILKDRYVEVLSEFAGESTKSYWEEIIIVKDLFSKEEKSISNKKRLLYCIGINEIYEEPDVYKKLIKERLDIMKSSERIEVFVKLYPENDERWKNMSDVSIDCGKSFKELAEICDAYYGSPSPVVPLFVQANKPTMISKKEI